MGKNFCKNKLNVTLIQIFTNCSCRYMIHPLFLSGVLKSYQIAELLCFLPFNDFIIIFRWTMVVSPRTALVVLVYESTKPIDSLERAVSTHWERFANQIAGYERRYAWLSLSKWSIYYP